MKYIWYPVQSAFSFFHIIQKAVKSIDSRMVIQSTSSSVSRLILWPRSSSWTIFVCSKYLFVAIDCNWIPKIMSSFALAAGILRLLYLRYHVIQMGHRLLQRLQFDGQCLLDTIVAQFWPWPLCTILESILTQLHVLLFRLDFRL